MPPTPLLTHRDHDDEDPTAAHITYLEITLHQLDRWINDPSFSPQEQRAFCEQRAEVQNALRHLSHALMNIDPATNPGPDPGPDSDSGQAAKFRSS